MMRANSFHAMFNQLWRAPAQGHAAKSVEIFGWIMLLEGVVIMFAPDFVASVLNLPPLVEQGANYFRLAALLVCGVGMLYVVSGRLDADGFVFASLLDRPLVPPTMAVLWILNIIPGPLALAFSVQDFAGFLWTLVAWRSELRSDERRAT
jgi:hypothetical protein